MVVLLMGSILTPIRAAYATHLATLHKNQLNRSDSRSRTEVKMNREPTGSITHLGDESGRSPLHFQE